MPVANDRKEQRGFAGLAALALIEGVEPPLGRATGPWETVGRTDRSGLQEPGKANSTATAGVSQDAGPKNTSTELDQSEQVSGGSGSGTTSTSNLKRNVAVVCCLLLVGVLLRLNADNVKPATSPPAQTVSTKDNDRTVILPTPPVSSPPQTQVEVPPWKGDGTRRLTIAMIRWCLFQQRRITHLREKFDNSRDTVDANTYNDMVDDYNDRCAAFKYVDSDMSRVRAELATKEVDLKADAARIWASWLPKPPLVSAAVPMSNPARSEEPLSKPGSPSSGSSNQNVGPAATDETKEQAGLDLLRMEDARKVQQRLIALKFLVGSTDGLWTSRSRSALREFKIVNGLARDDLFDVFTENALFSASANKKPVLALNGNKPKEVPEPEGRYPPPAGASLNPLNTGDAIALQKRLGQQGFFMGKPNGVWGLASRAALRDFKAVSNLPPNDYWDSDTERALMAEGSVRASETFIGGWGEDQSDCGPTQPGGARLRINTRQAEIEDVTCKFVAITRDGTGWRVAAECAKPGRKWSSDVKLEASAGRLTWTSNGETNAYLRCR